ncbi:hypothetical protein CHARACLAT_026867 [Characodon lateralis]|uniref:Uncharacterized protein n=1 Tax=Characodon lateralis TaxID=208331 RepID=A0ABU7DK36_9TELE|nr:hypothetical protein [Characodon lateralis]
MNAGYSNSKSLLKFVACDHSHSGSKLKSYVCLPARRRSTGDLCGRGLFVGSWGFYSNSDVVMKSAVTPLVPVHGLAGSRLMQFTLKVPEKFSLAFNVVTHGWGPNNTRKHLPVIISC